MICLSQCIQCVLEKNELCDVPCHHLLNIESYFKFKNNDFNLNRKVKCVGVKVRKHAFGILEDV